MHRSLPARVAGALGLVAGLVLAGAATPAPSGCRHRAPQPL